MKSYGRPPIPIIPDQSHSYRQRHHVLRHPSTIQGPLSLVFVWTLFPTKSLARPQPQDSSAPPPSDGNSGSGSSSNSSSDSSYSSSSLLNLYFLFIAIAVLLLLVALFLLHRRKKRRKAILRDSSNQALAQDINGNQYVPGGDPNASPLARTPWRWINGNGRAPVTRHEEGFNEHGEAPPPYGAPPGTMTPPVTVAAPGPPPVVPGAIPMRPLSRDSQGRKPPEYEYNGPEGAQSANSSTGNLMRGQQLQQPRQF